MLQFIRDMDRRSTSAPLVEREASVVCGRRTDLLRSAIPTLARRLVMPSRGQGCRASELRPRDTATLEGWITCASTPRALSQRANQKPSRQLRRPVQSA